MRKTSKQSYGGAFTPAGFPGRKAMSSKRFPVKGESHSTGGAINRSKVYTPESFPGSGCLNPNHGVTTRGPTKGMRNPEGRIGANKEGFDSNGFKQGPHPIGKGK